LIYEKSIENQEGEKYSRREKMEACWIERFRIDENRVNSSIGRGKSVQ
jgi:hypothetical protein